MSERRRAARGAPRRARAGTDARAPAETEAATEAARICLCSDGSARATACAAALRAAGARVALAPLPPARLATTAADAAATRAVAAAWHELGAPDAVVVWPPRPPAGGALPAAPRRWQRDLDAVVRAAYLTGRAAGLRLRAQGSGTVLVVIEAAPRGDAIAAVTCASLETLTGALGKALAPLHTAPLSVTRRTTPAAVARAVLARLAEPVATVPARRARRPAPSPG